MDNVSLLMRVRQSPLNCFRAKTMAFSNDLEQSELFLMGKYKSVCVGSNVVVVCTDWTAWGDRFVSYRFSLLVVLVTDVFCRCCLLSLSGVFFLALG